VPELGKAGQQLQREIALVLDLHHLRRLETRGGEILPSRFSLHEARVVMECLFAHAELVETALGEEEEM
jgi:hypothetical protein